MNNEILQRYPKIRPTLPPEYQAIYAEHYKNNREGKTTASFFSSHLEAWLHKCVARTAAPYKKTLEIGAGTLNQLNYEKIEQCDYDIVEPFELLYQDSKYLCQIGKIYKDIADVPLIVKYDRITAIACLEHICDLPTVIETSGKLLKPDGILSVSIPNEGRFLWKFAYTMTTGLEFKRKYGLDYDILMRNEHVNTADEIDYVLHYYFNHVKMKLLGLGKTFSFYRYYECSGAKQRP